MLMMAEFFNAVNEFRDQMRLHIRAELEELPLQPRTQAGPS
jgi:hypothetical protein